MIGSGENLTDWQWGESYDFIIIVKVKAKFTLEQATKAHRVSRGKVLLFI